MKYIRSINESVEDEIRKLINWNLINDIKDLSLEYLDEGFKLKINFIKEGITERYRVVLFELVFTHDRLIEQFPKFNAFRMVRGKFYYEILLDGREWSENLHATIDLKDISKRMYPEEKIETILFRKYTKLYESFETDLEDILLEVTDLGYCVSMGQSLRKQAGYYYINIKKDIHGDPFLINAINYKEIKDCVLRIKDYLGNRFMGCDAYNGLSAHNRKWSEFDLTECNVPPNYLMSLIIYYN